jgi:phosphocarrier protein FPr
VGRAAPLQGVDPPAGAAHGDADAECARLAAAIDAVSDFLRRLAAAAQAAQRGVLDAHLALLADPTLQQQAAAQMARGASAGAAWRATLRGAAASR